MKITSFTPPSGAVNSTVSLSVSEAPADASQDNTTVILSGAPTVTVTSMSLDPEGNGTIEITLEVNSQSGEFGVIINSSQGFIDAQSAGNFTVDLPATEPQITSLNPQTAIAGQTQLSLSGINLQEIQSVYVGTVRVMSIQLASDTLIRLTVPSAVQSGRVRVSGQSPEFGRVNCPIMLTVK